MSLSNSLLLPYPVLVRCYEFWVLIFFAFSNFSNFNFLSLLEFLWKWKNGIRWINSSGILSSKKVRKFQCHATNQHNQQKGNFAFEKQTFCGKGWGGLGCYSKKSELGAFSVVNCILAFNFIKLLFFRNLVKFENLLFYVITEKW